QRRPAAGTQRRGEDRGVAATGRPFQGNDEPVSRPASKRLLATLVFGLLGAAAAAQHPAEIILEKNVAAIESALADDSMEGRPLFGAGGARAARFIEAQFRGLGLDTLPGNDGYRQSFPFITVQPLDMEVRLDGQ